MHHAPSFHRSHDDISLAILGAVEGLLCEDLHFSNTNALGLHVLRSCNQLTSSKVMLKLQVEMDKADVPDLMLPARQVRDGLASDDQNNQQLHQLV